MKNKPKLLLASVLAITFCATSSQAQLPPEVQADLLQDKIVSSLQAKDFKAVKSNISDYRKLDIEIPPAILLIDAKISISEKKWKTSKGKLEEYFASAGKTHSSYTEALKLYKTVDQEIQSLQNRLEAQEQAIIRHVAKMGTNLAWEFSPQAILIVKA